MKSLMLLNGVLEGQKKEYVAEETFEEIMAKNFQKLSQLLSFPFPPQSPFLFYSLPCTSVWIIYIGFSRSYGKLILTDTISYVQFAVKSMQ